jgi:hypothetical protein
MHPQVLHSQLMLLLLVLLLLVVVELVELVLVQEALVLGLFLMVYTIGGKKNKKERSIHTKKVIQEGKTLAHCQKHFV